MGKGLHKEINSILVSKSTDVLTFLTARTADKIDLTKLITHKHLYFSCLY